MTQTSAVSHPPESTAARLLAPSRLRDLIWLGSVAGAFTVLQLVLSVPGTGLGWDETVYVSQVSPDAPAAFFSAPRARGVTFLVAPVTVLTSSVTALRVYLALLSGAALLLSLWLWRPLLPVRVLALAGVLFATLWITLLYGPQVMPNLWAAYAALIATACFLRAAGVPSDHSTQAAPSAPSLQWTSAEGTTASTARELTDYLRPRGRNTAARRALPGLAAAIACAALLRPTDAFWLALPLAVATLCVRRWRRRPALLLALVAGGAIGCAPWAAEAYLSYGGLLPRLHRASEIQGELGWNFAVDDQVRALAGRTLCRPCDVPWRDPLTALWFFALPLLVIGGCLAARRTPQRTALNMAALTGVFAAFPYLLLIGYAAPRFLLPAYALLALPTAYALMHLARTVRPRSLVAAGLVLALAAHLTVQYLTLTRITARYREDGVAFTRISAELNRLGVRPPCVVNGTEYVRIGFGTGCSSRQTGGHDGSITVAGLEDLARRMPMAVIVREDATVPRYARTWTAHPLPALPGKGELTAYLSPSTTSAPQPAASTLSPSALSPSALSPPAWRASHR
ncbi:hypothetical protein [Streptomyces sp. MUM 178J]|uniref:hypothetical protein n=1 Tax=Streptomyces sp. MUM 178J TaxID=2791991 RepID=UPI001F0504AC|nr:hypothetical protein [Streptomyces sp. MUM 178J]WRQ82814.1 hypothetical protein I3F59_027635 [Streptomyces sp. MUM 178J]